VVYELYLDKLKQRERRVEILKAGTQVMKEEEKGTLVPIPEEQDLAALQNFKTSRKFEEGLDTDESDREKRRNGVKRRWYLGIQSKKDPGLVMNEVYSALRYLEFEWKVLNPYCIRARWAPPGTRSLDKPDDVSVYKVKLGLQLYKVEHGIFLLDFYKVWGDQFYFLE
jgi:hypothetical protein